MQFDHQFPPAPWPLALKWSSSLGLIVMIGVSVAAFHAIPVPSGLNHQFTHQFGHQFGIGVAFIPAAVLAWSLCTRVVGYALTPGHVAIRRSLGSVIVPLSEVTRAYADPAVRRGAVRVIGNGGLFGFTGLFYSRRLGRFHLYATDFKHAVVVVTTQRTVVITPADPQAFLNQLHRYKPQLPLTAPDAPPP